MTTTAEPTRQDAPTIAFGWVALILFVLTIPAANAFLEAHGLWHWRGYAVPSGVIFISVSFVLRDLAQITLGKGWTWAAIVVGTVLSWWLASPALALASGMAFLWSESTDALIFTPLANRGKFLAGVILGGWLASLVDSAIFMRLAFQVPVLSWEWLPLFLAKCLFVAIATPFAGLVRRVFA